MHDQLPVATHYCRKTLTSSLDSSFISPCIHVAVLLSFPLNLFHRAVFHFHHYYALLEDVCRPGGLPSICTGRFKQ